MKFLGVVILAAILSLQFFFAAAHSVQPRGVVDCAAKTLELTSAVSNCQLPSDVPEVDFESIFEALDTVSQFLNFL